MFHEIGLIKFTANNNMLISFNFAGVESVSIDMKEKKLTLTGDVDPVDVVGKLKKLCRTEILSVGPAKEEKKEQPKKEEKKKDPNDISELVKAYEAYYCQMRPQYYYVSSVEENPTGCVIF